MPVFYQHVLDADSRLGIWKIEESESFFTANVPLMQEVNHPHKRLQHLAGRFLLRFLFPDFPYELIRIADTNKPFLENEAYHFSISHCGDYAAAMVSRTKRVGMDIELPAEKILRIASKFATEEDQNAVRQIPSVDIFSKELLQTTIIWSAKEAVFKWYGLGGVDFREHIQLMHAKEDTMQCLFAKTNQHLRINIKYVEPLVLAWTATE